MPKPPEEFRIEEDLEFLGEQDGPYERLLKEKLVQAFSSTQIVQRAYLARVRYAERLNVVLALRAEPGQERFLVGEISPIFASVFNANEFQDIIFPTEAQELRLQTVCQPFFMRSQTGN